MQRLKSSIAGMCIVIMAALVFALAAPTQATDDLGAGMALFNQGKPEKAAVCIKRAYLRDSLDAATRFAFARVCVSDGLRSRALFASVAGDSAAADSLRAAALIRLGHFAYCAGAYDSAANLYLRASALYPTDASRHFQTRAARSAGHSLMPARSGRDGNTGTSAAPLVNPGADSTGTNLAHALSEKRLPDTAQSELRPAVGLPRAAATRYALQVGAFASEENAVRAARELRNTFDTVSLIKVTAESSTVYRVRLGSFSSEQEALDWGERTLRPAGRLFRVVVE
jgi:tetratricopeptide (TPR) repeat protein